MTLSFAYLPFHCFQLYWRNYRFNFKWRQWKLFLFSQNEIFLAFQSQGAIFWGKIALKCNFFGGRLALRHFFWAETTSKANILGSTSKNSILMKNRLKRLLLNQFPTDRRKKLFSNRFHSTQIYNTKFVLIKIIDHWFG